MGIYDFLSRTLYGGSQVQRTPGGISPTPVPTPSPTRSVDQNFLSQFNIQPLSPQTNNNVYPTLNTSPVLGASTSSGGGGGGGGGNTNNAFGLAEDSARQQNDAELQSALSGFDYNKSALEGQLGQAGSQKDTLLSQIETGLGSARSQAESSTKRAEESTSQNTQDALTTAQEVQRKNRNILRSLGILNSSAAGELLSKPLNEYDTQRARLMTALQQRKEDIDIWVQERVSEAQSAKENIIQQYQSIVSNIQNDLRFNDRQRADAVRAAGAALSQRISELKLAQANWNSQYQSANNELLAASKTLNDYVNPSYNAAGIQAQTVTPGTTQNPSQVGIYGDPRRQGENDLLSGMGSFA